MRITVRGFWNRLFGDRGERAAARHLRRHGMRIMTRGYDTPWGEIDLIARDGDVLVFAEVKTRRQGVPAEAVTPDKQRRITLAALHFLRSHNLLEERCRFDVVAIVWSDDHHPPQIEHIPRRLRGRRPRTVVSLGTRVPGGMLLSDSAAHGRQHRFERDHLRDPILARVDQRSGIDTSGKVVNHRRVLVVRLEFEEL